MKKVLILYKTKYGAIKEYAEELSKRLNCDILDFTNAKMRVLDNYDIILYGGGIHAGGIREFDKFSKWIKYNPDKEYICFACGINISSFDARAQLRDINFYKDYLKNITCYYLDGRFNPNSITKVDRVILNWTRKMLLSKGELNFTKEDKELINRIDNGYDGINFDELDKIIKDVEERREA